MQYCQKSINRGDFMSCNDKWFEVTILTTSDAVEAVSAILYDAGVAGVSIEDPQDVLSSNTPPGSWDYIDEKLIPSNNGEVKVKGYFPETEDMESKLSKIAQSIDRLGQWGIEKGKGEITTKPVYESDWANAWKQYYKPFKIGNRIVIKPTWEDYESQPDDIIVELDPGMAFGTGTHETTRMCVDMLEKYVHNGSTVFDIGCGSGILSIVSSKLGASEVIGVDIDEVAVKSSRENVKISGVKNVEIIHGNLLEVIKSRSDIIVANIIADVIVYLAGVVPDFLKPAGVFICSGIIKDRAKDVKKAIEENGLRILETQEMGEWVAFAATLEG